METPYLLTTHFATFSKTHQRLTNHNLHTVVLFVILVNMEMKNANRAKLVHMPKQLGNDSAMTVQLDFTKTNRANNNAFSAITRPLYTLVLKEQSIAFAMKIMKK